MTLTKQEFNVLLMLYAASIDGNIRKEEVEEILEQASPESYRKVKKSFSQMSDMEVLDLINENKSQFITNEAEKQQVLDQLRAVVSVDDSVSPIENYLLQTLNRIL